MEIKLKEIKSVKDNEFHTDTVVSLLLPDVRFPNVPLYKSEEIHLSLETANRLVGELSRLLAPIPY